MRFSRRIAVGVALAGLLPGCAGVPARVAEPPLAAALAPQGVVFCADGSGGFGTTSAALRDAVAEGGSALEVRSVAWTHGVGRVISDQVNAARARAVGQRLAGEVLAWRREHPGRPVYLVGHSAGSQVVLTAVECLPVGAVDRVVLLAPSVSAGYDLRPALARSRCGVDAFYSGGDWLVLGLGIGVIGTADRRWSAAAGRVGFCPAGCATADFALYAKLRQHPWHPCVAWSGHHGGHYSYHAGVFLRAYVLPLLPPGRAE